MTEKHTCIKCGEAKPLAEFAYDAHNRGVCHECYKAYHKAYYERQKAKNAHKRKKIDQNKTKVCIRCGLEKPETEYTYDKANARLINTCKACKALKTKKTTRLTNPQGLRMQKSTERRTRTSLRLIIKNTTESTPRLKGRGLDNGNLTTPRGLRLGVMLTGENISTSLESETASMPRLIKSKYKPVIKHGLRRTPND